MVQLWSDAVGYEAYVGRWSRVLAPAFVTWLDAPAGAKWLDFGCGTGALTEAIASGACPAAIVSLDRSIAYLRHVRTVPACASAALLAADGTRSPIAPHVIDVAVSGLVLNFVDADAVLQEQLRVTSGSATIGAYVWDYAGGYELVRRFWDAARRVDPTAEQHDPGGRFSLCNPQALAGLFQRHGLTRVRTTSLIGHAEFPTFNDYWTALDVRQGSLAEYLSGLGESQRTDIRERLRRDLQVELTEPVRLRLSAFAVAGTRGPTPGRSRAV